MPSDLEARFALMWESKYPEIDLYTEFSYIPNRKFRADYWHPCGVVIEIQGGTWQKGAHSSGVGIQRDCEKACLTASLGYLLFPLTAEMVDDDRYLEMIAKAIKMRSVFHES